MSGGYFDYQQHHLDEIAYEIEHLIESNKSEELDEFEEKIGREYSAEVIEKFEEAVFFLRLASIYVQRIDWLVSSDDSEESFLNRLHEEMKELIKEMKEE